MVFVFLAAARLYWNGGRTSLIVHEHSLGHAGIRGSRLVRVVERSHMLN
jgi:hypothetical protein